ncbi:MAG: serine/threonine-protein phosphatase, partial [Polyangiaceae bacterium]
MHPIGIGLSDVGRMREQNEDNLLVDDDLGLYIVSDGMGGHVGGEIASDIAVASVAREIGRKRSVLIDMAEGEVDRDLLESVAIGAVRQASRAIFDAGD